MTFLECEADGPREEHGPLETYHSSFGQSNISNEIQKAEAWHAGS